MKIFTWLWFRLYLSFGKYLLFCLEQASTETGFGKIAFVDNVTGGNTYNKFLVDVQETLSNKINKQFYILSFDVDNFKYINNFTGLPAAIRFCGKYTVQSASGCSQAKLRHVFPVTVLYVSYWMQMKKESKRYFQRSEISQKKI